MKWTKEQRQASYERQRNSLIGTLTKPPICDLLTDVDHFLTVELLGGRCLTLLKTIHGGTFRLVGYIIKDWVNLWYWHCRGRLWRLRHRLRGLSNDEIDELIFADDDKE